MTQNPKKIIIIGAGFAGLSASCYLAQAGHEVTIMEKNSHIGGRANVLHRDGFTFDMGPTFYWMPDVFESFFSDFNKRPSDYYELHKLGPAYKVVFGPNDSIDIEDSTEAIIATFESIEPGSGPKLTQFLKGAEENYKLAINRLVYKPGQSLAELVEPATITRLDLFIKNIKGQVAKVVNDPRLRKVLEFPVLFLGAKSSVTPAFYNFMNWADFGLGTWHPHGGFHKVAEGLATLATDLGVEIKTEEEILSIEVESGTSSRLRSSSGDYEYDILVSGADYAHTEQLLPDGYKNYSEKYWDNKTFAPSALLFYIALDEKVKNLNHHTLFFDVDFSDHESAIYDHPEWVENPLFYTSVPSMTDSTFAPAGKEAMTVLIPLAPGLREEPGIRDKYFEKVITRLSKQAGQDLKSSVLFWESFGIRDFVQRYHSYKGNAYGLANTLLQTHILRPKMKHPKVKNLYFTGQITVPGPGVPPSIISGKIVSDLIIQQYQ